MTRIEGNLPKLIQLKTCHGLETFLLLNGALVSLKQFPHLAPLARKAKQG
jgi:hypothetical protein